MEEIVMLNGAVLDLATWWRLSERRSGRVEHHCQLMFETVTITPAFKKKKKNLKQWKPGRPALMVNLFVFSIFGVLTFNLYVILDLFFV